MKWTITDNLAAEVTEVEAIVTEGDHEPLFEFKNEVGEKFGVQLLDGDISFGVWNEAGEWVKMQLVADDDPGFDELTEAAVYTPPPIGCPVHGQVTVVGSALVTDCGGVCRVLSTAESKWTHPLEGYLNDA